VAIADLNGDGKQDVLMGMSPNMMGMTGNGDGTFNSATAFNINLGIDPLRLRAMDLTGSGLPDILLGSTGAGSTYSLQVLAASASTQSLAATTTTLTASANTINVGQSVTFTATVAPQSGSGTPTGSVNFLDGTTVIGSGTLNGSGVATYSTSSLTAGSQSISAGYQGDSNFAASTSGTVTVQVNAATADFSLATSPASQTISPGQTTSYTATLSPLNGFNQAVTLACTGAPATTTCALAKSSVTLNGTSNTTDQVNVTTTAGSMAFRWGVTTGRRLLAFSVAFLPLLCGFAARWLRRRALSRPYFLALVACGLFLALCMTACGGGGGSHTSTQTGTPAGTYTLTITGTSGSLTHSTTVSLVVQ
jgi:hypothetical protein